MRKFFWAAMVTMGDWIGLSDANRRIGLAIARDQFYASPELDVHNGA
jgi:hypothetical protein